MNTIPTAQTRRGLDLVLMQETERRVAPLVGVKVVAQGRLAVEEFGHPVGTQFVTIEADSVDEAQMAAEDLAEFARIPQEGWHGTWNSRRTGDGYVLIRNIFPVLSQV